MKFHYTRPIKFLLLLLTLGVMILSLEWGERPVHANRGGPQESLTNAPAFGAIPAEGNCTACHFGNALNASGGTFQILDVPASYMPGQEYTIKVSLNRGTLSRAGFQLTALTDDGQFAGTLTSTDNRTQKVSGQVGSSNRDYIEHTNTGSSISPAGTAEWTFKWTAPATRGGKITFYASGNAANNNNSQLGDFIYTATAVMRPNIETVNAASFDKTFTATNSGIVAGFGLDLATTTETATGDADPNTPGIQLPTTLAGTTVKVKDSLNVERNATLFFVSAGQVNYLLPNSMANGNAMVTITSGNGAISMGALTVATVKPGVFTVNQSGTGYAAAEIQRVRNGQTIGFELVATGPVAAPVAVPIEWKDPNDELYLVLYGTGIRQRSQLSNVTVTVKGASQQVVAALAHPVFAGLDQVNALLNRNLAGSGDVDVILTVDGVVANTVRLNFK
jgi:uncharacterized protein (TIGR03437 family)